MKSEITEKVPGEDIVVAIDPDLARALLLVIVVFLVRLLPPPVLLCRNLLLFLPQLVNFRGSFWLELTRSTRLVLIPLRAYRARMILIFVISKILLLVMSRCGDVALPAVLRNLFISSSMAEHNIILTIRAAWLTIWFLPFCKILRNSNLSFRSNHRLPCILPLFRLLIFLLILLLPLLLMSIRVGHQLLFPLLLALHRPLLLFLPLSILLIPPLSPACLLQLLRLLKLLQILPL